MSTLRFLSPLLVGSAALISMFLMFSCATPRVVDTEACRIAQMDIAAAEACLAEPTCAAKWDGDLFRMQLNANRDYVAKHCGSRP